MGSVFVKVDGLSEMGDVMRVLGAEVNNRLCRRATNAGAQVIKRRAKEGAPVAAEPYVIDGQLVQPGNLKKNIIVARVANSQLTSEHIVTVKHKGTVGQPYRVGVFNEYGTVKMSPQPFMRPAFESGKSEALDAITDELSAGIDRAVAKAAK